MTHPDPQNADTPTPADTQAEIDYRKRYEDLQPEYTRTTQELARLRRIEAGEDPDGLRALLERYGYKLPDDNEPDEPEPEEDTDPYDPEDVEQLEDPRLTRFDQFVNQYEQQQQQAAIQQEWNGWQEYVVEQAKQAGVELRPQEIKGLQIDCMDADGTPIPPGKADKVLENYLKDREAWIEELVPKGRRSRVPAVPANGQAPTGDKDPADMTDAEKEAYMLARLQAEQA